MSTFDPPSALSAQQPILTSSTVHPPTQEEPQSRASDLPLPVTSVVDKVIDQTGEKVKAAFQEFLLNFTDLSTATISGSFGQDEKCYVQQIKQLKLEERITLFVNFHHLTEFNQLLADAVCSNYYRFEPFLCKAIFNMVKRIDPDYAILEGGKAQQFRPFYLSIYNLPELLRLRELRTGKVGQLVSISGIVTRTTEARPELTFGTFRCLHCNTVIRDVEQQFKYTEPSMCQQPTCQNQLEWELLIDQSQFVDWQKVRIQENPNEIPTGSMPRSMDVILRNEMVERVKPGDKIIFTGTLIVVPDVSQLKVAGSRVESQKGSGPKVKNMDAGVTGLKALGVRDLTYRLAFVASFTQPAESKDATSIVTNEDIYNCATSSPAEIQQAVLESFSASERQELLEMQSTPNLYSKIVNSLAPTIFGNEEVKRAVLLQLLGGVHKVTPEGIHLRGDINVCIVGDPSTSKSQFLKYVVDFMPRAVYTSGKASSAAGLTASVAKDEETGEFTIEAGALMLADNGICCIDEFDKMDIRDQVAIHEAMEQQTISIAKAGIHATLNARTSILAAANPVHGRYDKKLSLKQNISMSPPIMSRFDLFFVLLDECNEVTDYNIARHLVSVHQRRDEAVRPEFSTGQLKRYFKYAKCFFPRISEDARKLLVSQFRQLRLDDSSGTTSGKSGAWRITVRQLESMIRLSEALARLYCEEEVKPKHVKEAYRLLQTSIIRVENEDVDLDDQDQEVSGHGEAPFMAPSDISVPSAASSSHPDQVVAEQAKKFSITFEQFQKMKNMMAHRLGRVEEEGDGVKHEELVTWYLEQIEDELHSVEQLEEAKALTERVIKRCRKDGVFIALKRQMDFSGETSSMDGVESEKDVLYVLHPNYVLE